jgi:DNA-binding Lrp family transcriptional regulator
MKDSELDSLDIRIVGMLQANPRESWASLGQRLEMSPVTLARRWARLTEAGLAWTTISPDLTAVAPGTGGLSLAFVELQVAAGHMRQVATQMARMDQVVSADITAGGHTMMLVAIAESAMDIAMLIIDEFDSIEGIADVRSHLGVRAVTDGSRWRLLSDPAERKAGLQPTPRSHEPLDTPLLASVARELGADARISATDLADRLGVSQRAARDAVSRVLSSGRVRLRAEMPRKYTPWPVSVYLFLRVPPLLRESAARQLASVREVRTVAETLGTYNIIVNAWVASLADVQKLEVALASKLPEVELGQTQVVLHTVKDLGRTFNEHQRASGYIPLRTYLSRGKG